MSDAFVKPAPASDRIVLAVDGVSRRRRVGPVSFDGHGRRDRSAWSGLRGAGHHTIGRAIFGQIPISARPDRRSTAGRSIRADPAEAMRKQIGFVSSRRGEESLAANMVGPREHLS